MMLGILIGFAAALLGSWLGFRDGRKRGALLERRAEAMRRLTAKAETEWSFSKAQTGQLTGEPGLLLYARSPDGHEFTRRFDDTDTTSQDARERLGYDDAWYSVESATKISAVLANEITNRFNSWQILVATKARTSEGIR
jgi:hypothetical protein